MSAPANLGARSGDGTAQPLVRAGASLPANARIVFSTSRPGQDQLLLDLVEDDERLVARASFALPRGLPANCWIPIYFTVDADLRIQAEARENLRRINIAAVFDASERAAAHYTTP